MSSSEALFGNLMGAGKWGSSEEGDSGNGKDKTKATMSPTEGSAGSPFSLGQIRRHLKDRER